MQSGILKQITIMFNLKVSTNNGVTWIPQCGLYTNAGENNNSIQPVGEPLYDGIQSDWVKGGN